jgi:hypothetical protein
VALEGWEYLSVLGAEDPFLRCMLLYSDISDWTRLTKFGVDDTACMRAHITDGSMVVRSSGCDLLSALGSTEYQRAG